MCNSICFCQLLLQLPPEHTQLTPINNMQYVTIAHHEAPHHYIKVSYCLALLMRSQVQCYISVRSKDAALKSNLRALSSTSVILLLSSCLLFVCCAYVCVQVVGTEYDTDRSRTPFHGYQLIAQSQV
jgi:hypothetical protein